MSIEKSFAEELKRRLSEKEDTAQERSRGLQPWHLYVVYAASVIGLVTWIGGGFQIWKPLIDSLK